MQLLSRFLGFRTVESHRAKKQVVLRGKGYAWALVLGSFDKSKRYGSSPTRLFSVLRAV